MVFSEQLEKEIDDYYKLKHEYNQKQNVNIAKIMSNNNLTMADKRARVKEMKVSKQKCIRCNKEGGTLFEESATELNAVCNAEPKCDFNIKVVKGDAVILLPELLSRLRLRLEKEKNALMVLKIKHALEMISDDEAVQQFDEKQDIFRRLTIGISTIEEKLLSVTNNESKNSEINTLKVELYKAIDEYKSSLREFSGTGREEFMRDALEKYDDEILSLASKLRESKYNLNAIEMIETSSNTSSNPVISDNQYKLLQEKYILKDLEVPFIKELRALLDGVDVKISKSKMRVNDTENVSKQKIADEGAGGFL